MPEKGIRSHYRWLWVTMWLLGFELRPFRRAVGALNHWAISPTPLNFFSTVVILVCKFACSTARSCLEAMPIKWDLLSLGGGEIWLLESPLLSWIAFISLCPSISSQHDSSWHLNPTSLRVQILPLCVQPRMATKHECGEKDDDTKTHLKVQEAVAEDSCLRKLIQGSHGGWLSGVCRSTQPCGSTRLPAAVGLRPFCAVHAITLCSNSRHC